MEILLLNSESDIFFRSTYLHRILLQRIIISNDLKTRGMLTLTDILQVTLSNSSPNNRMRYKKIRHINKKKFYKYPTVMQVTNVIKHVFFFTALLLVL